jgi:hypothetical protein
VHEESRGEKISCLDGEVVKYVFRPIHDPLSLKETFQTQEERRDGSREFSTDLLVHMAAEIKQ